MGYYATATAYLALRDGADPDEVGAVVEAWEPGWELLELTGDAVGLAFSAKYRNVKEDLDQLVPFVAEGEAVQFAGEDNAVWRLVFWGGDVIDQAATFPPLPRRPSGAVLSTSTSTEEPA